MKKTTFCSALECAKAKGWIVGGGERGKRYNLDPQGSWKNSEEGSVHGSTPSRGVEPTEPINLSSNEPTSNRLRTDEPNASCKNVDTTAHNKNPNQINEGESSSSVMPGPSDDELIKAGIAAAKKSAKAR
jgi:hypothetical protein